MALALAEIRGSQRQEYSTLHGLRPSSMILLFYFNRVLKGKNREKEKKKKKKKRRKAFVTVPYDKLLR